MGGWGKKGGREKALYLFLSVFAKGGKRPSTLFLNGFFAKAPFLAFLFDWGWREGGREGGGDGGGDGGGEGGKGGEATALSPKTRLSLTWLLPFEFIAPRKNLAQSGFLCLPPTWS